MRAEGVSIESVLLREDLWLTKASWERLADHQAVTAIFGRLAARPTYHLRLEPLADAGLLLHVVTAGLSPALEDLETADWRLSEEACAVEIRGTGLFAEEDLIVRLATCLPAEGGLVCLSDTLLTLITARRMAQDVLRSTRLQLEAARLMPQDAVQR